jgi:hypothetical protein
MSRSRVGFPARLAGLWSKELFLLSWLRLRLRRWLQGSDYRHRCFAAFSGSHIGVFRTILWFFLEFGLLRRSLLWLNLRRS